MTSDKS